MIGQSFPTRQSDRITPPNHPSLNLSNPTGSLLSKHHHICNLGPCFRRDDVTGTCPCKPRDHALSAQAPRTPHPPAFIDTPKQHGPAIAGPCEVLQEGASAYFPATTLTISKHLVE
jgi:hypothetical protein